MEHSANLSGLLTLLRDQPAYRALLARLTLAADFPAPSAKGGAQGIAREALGLLRAARPCVVAALARDARRPVLVVCSRADQVASFAEQLLAWEPSLHVLTFADPNPLFYERAAWGPRTIRARVRVLAEWAFAHDPLDAGLSREGEPGVSSGSKVILTSAHALMQRTLPPDLFRAHSLNLRRGDRIPGGQPDTLLRRWLDVGYEPATVVTEPGQFTRRGGILDVFPVAAEWPARIELWGDEIESLRVFDPATQRSLEEIDQLVVTPAREALPCLGPQAASSLVAWFAARRVSEDDADTLLADDRRGLAEGVAFPAIEFYLPWMVATPASLLDYLPPNALVFVDGAEELAEAVADLEAQSLDLRRAYEEAGHLPAGTPPPYVTWDELSDVLWQAGMIDLHAPPDEPGLLAGLFAPGPHYGGQLRAALEEMRRLTRDTPPARVVVVSRQADRLAELWYEHGGHRALAVETVTTPPPSGSVTFVRGALAQGWLLSPGQVAAYLLTDAEIFGWKRPEPRRRPQRRAIAPEDFFADLAPGDLVVHAEYGIGHFQGLEKRFVGGSEREFLLVAYAGGDVLYVPIHQADRLSRYVGPDGSEPELSRLGTAGWSRVKAKAREDVEQTARELLALYATREMVQGHAFSPDTAWQHELEASFPYVETEDQLRALAEVKADMERPRPMDRLIAGDVGYGKTEVALRAAFKAVMDNKQVAILVPTTVLAQQHYETFTRRLAAFPVNVEMLSRFRTRAEQERIVAGLASGQVDIVIGTHRLLGQDVIFRDLGLLIIDEEQRFGVTHKERLKRMRTEVDVLTLTATPIPRTLYMSLTGVRDISTINTPPEERLPVVTVVGRRNDDLIRQAILRELDRGGQVFYVHNRVQSIHAEARRLRELVPQARIAVGHGQMAEEELEAVMEQFAEGEIDVLVSTSIIEAGLDIPNANTLIVDRADQFGLAQLHQLRGRVGRSAARAYAYFFHPPLRQLTAEARARLETIGEQTHLGAGMNIAMRDLELRGAGEILGTRQHGAMAMVGFHLYTRMLSQAVQRLRAEREGSRAFTPEGESAAQREVVTIDLPIPTYIPTDYVPDMGLRVQLYRRLADLHSEAAIDELGVELADRFGPLPLPVENLLFQLRVKLLALRADVEAVTGEGDQIAIRLPGLAHLDRPALQRRLGYDVRVSRTAVWLPYDHGSEDWRPALLDVLARLASRRLLG